MLSNRNPDNYYTFRGKKEEILTCNDSWNDCLKCDKIYYYCYTTKENKNRCLTFNINDYSNYQLEWYIE